MGSRFERGIDNPMLSDELDDLTEVVSKFDSYDGARFLQGRYGSWHVHVDNHWGVSAQRKMTSFFDDYYNRIFIIPAALDAGNLLSTQVRHIILWNAYVTPQTLEAAVLGPQAGISMAPPAGVSIPYEMQPLRELDFTVQIELAGPPTINSYARFTVEGVNYTVPITGRRIVLFPFSPNWGSPVDETITHRSWVLSADDGSEQTGSESGEIPRRTLEFNINLRTSMQAQRAENLLFAWQARFFGVPHWGEESRTDAAAAAGSDVIAFDTFGLSLEPGSLVALYLDDEVNEIREVQQVTADGVRVTTGLEHDWPADSRVYPCFVGLLNEEMSGQRETSRVGRMAMAFDFEPSVTPGNTAFNPNPLTYRGHELYIKETNWLSAMPFSFSADTKRMDTGTGKFVAFTTSGFSKMGRRHNWTLFNRADIFEFRQFLGRRQGVARSVYMPSGTEDFIMAATILDTENSLVVQSNEYAKLVGAHPARRDIIITLKDGRYFCRRITTVSEFDNLTRLQLDTALGVEVSPQDVRRISFLTLYRFQSPSTTLRYLTDSKATVESMLVTKMTED
ncbi:tail assembly protein [Stenotrophomonas phage Suzuki]|nr:tail assembly protein [Stenotrophomonas phage Suzuki]